MSLVDDGCGQWGGIIHNLRWKPLPAWCMITVPSLLLFTMKSQSGSEVLQKLYSDQVYLFWGCDGAEKGNVLYAINHQLTLAPASLSYITKVGLKHPLSITQLQTQKYSSLLTCLILQNSCLSLVLNGTAWDSAALETTLAVRRAGCSCHVKYVSGQQFLYRGANKQYAEAR